MRINMCAAIIVMQSVFLIGAHVEAQQVFTHSQVLLFKINANSICNVLHGWSRGQKNEQQNNVHSPKKKQCSCRLSGSSEN